MQGVNVGSRIRERREKAGLTQAQLAEAVFATRQTVGNWERGATLPDIQSLQLLASVFRVTVDELLGTSAAELAREAVNDRRMLMRSFAMEWVYIAVIAATGFARFALERSGAERVSLRIRDGACCLSLCKGPLCCACLVPSRDGTA